MNQHSGVDPSDRVSACVAASGCRDPSGDPNRLVHAVAVRDRTDRWTVLREYADFSRLADALPLPEGMACPLPPRSGRPTEVRSVNDVSRIAAARNALQNWTDNLLLFPSLRNAPATRHFLTENANVVPPHLENLSWLSFQNQFRDEENDAAAHVASATPEPEVEMEMDEMFPTDDDDDDEDDFYGVDDDDDDGVDYSASDRYRPTEEAVSHEDAMDIIQEDLEPIEDVGSLAQSLGASHLGRSLQLQAEHMQTFSGAVRALQQQQHPSSSNDVGNSSSSVVLSPATVSATVGGIGNVMRSAPPQAMPQPSDATRPVHEGLGDSFHRNPTISAPMLDSFQMIKVIGKGSFGKVFLVRENKTNELFALKVLRKDNIIKRNQVEHTRTERSVLGYVKHPFIVGLNMAFQSKDKLYFVLDYCAGGELFFHLGKVGKFSEPRACFYAAEITLAIDYVHQLDIVYRDLKPENVLLDARGHVRLTDFGLSKEGISDDDRGTNSFCGTPEYLAPEILNRSGHGRAVDWWSLGALLYEMLTGLPPFYCRDRERLFEKIRRGELTYPRYLTPRSVSLLRGLLTRDPRKRLGSGPTDAEMIKSHAFFAENDIDWERLATGERAPPWNPNISGSLDTSLFDREFTEMPIISPAQNPHGAFIGAAGANATSQENVFEGFTFTDRTYYPTGE